VVIVAPKKYQEKFRNWSVYVTSPRTMRITCCEEV